MLFRKLLLNEPSSSNSQLNLRWNFKITDNSNLRIHNKKRHIIKMISIKMQIDCLIRSNKIVIFLNDPPEGPKQEKKSFQQKAQIKSQNKAKLNIVKLLEAYGITSRYITMIELRKLVNAKICETYIKSYYCNDCDIRVSGFKNRPFFSYHRLN